MKFLILSVSAGGGHMNAAEALKAHILSKHPEAVVEVIDTIKYINPILDKVIIGSYLKSLKLYPSFFRALYNYAESDEGIATVSNKFNEFMSYKILPLINEFNPDIIISTHPFSTEMMSILKSKGRILKPVITILTDHAPHSFWIHPYIDAFIVSNHDMKEEMITRGVDKDIVYDLGIPVHPAFLKHHFKQDTLKGLNLDTNKTTLLLMGGSLGIGNILDVYKQLSDIPINFQIIVIAGNNKKLLSSLMDITTKSSKETRIVGYTSEVNKYMQASDVLITKPGGLTVSEALICNIPLAIFSAIPGQEEKNAEFLLKNNLAINLGDGKNCGSIINDLLLDETKLLELKENCKTFAKPNSAKDILALIENLIKK